MSQTTILNKKIALSALCVGLIFFGGFLILTGLSAGLIITKDDNKTGVAVGGMVIGLTITLVDLWVLYCIFDKDRFR